MADCSADVVLIDAFENAVKFGNALFRLGNFTLTLPGLFFGFLETLLSRGFLKPWGVSSRQINYYCTDGRIPGAVKMAGVWLIPKEAEKPKDRRYNESR